ncbi:LysM peptidoglycan-binding domain-containing protein [Rhodospirillaceae bacterium KN72]|uniref:LysM peptidoglycan-binding domain-containing protein n=1 Tax=Pacificispira spongiicola TaxID=2729598 RepID=A0A7Y0DZ85_9PROT|nr:LysM peptidoglycan-binding domain-containing protein [Pacificispira spongiicola]NMM44208.1 LysM peptidoglycan-binding domain-containing protein [Pacificispira spongiicola]
MNRTVLIGVIGGILLLLALLLNWWSMPSTDPVSDGAPATAETTDSGNADTAGTSTTPAPEIVTTDPSVGQTEDQDPLADPIKPTFDVVRVDPNGDTVIAGRAHPLATVTVRDNDTDLGQSTADDRGEWVYLPTSPLEPGPHELKLSSVLPDDRTVEGDGTVVLVVPKPGHDVSGQPLEEGTQQQPLVVLIPEKGKPGAELIQKPGGASGMTGTAEPGGVSTEDGSLTVETIDYDQDGNISISGRGPEGSTIIAYLNNAPIGDGSVGEDGYWRVDPEQEVSPGVYRLRFDAVRDASVIARLEIPFSRAAPLADLDPDSFIVVQPGNSLWRIARRTLGTGFSYTEIYEANSDQIRDPDLIYPGQVFEIPK